MNKLWSVLFGAVMLAAALLFVVAPFLGWWLPKNVSSFGGGVDNLFYLILAITGFFFILTEGLLVYFMYKYAGGPEHRQPAPAAQGYGHQGFWTEHRVEQAWTVVPAIILLVLALVQIDVWADIKYQSRMPKFSDDKQPLQIEVSARQFEWRMRYPSAERMKAWAKKEGESGYEDPRRFAQDKHADDIVLVSELHAWQNQRVLVQLKTQDVLHSFYLPNLRLKQDAVPGKTIPVWFMATEPNTKLNGDHWEDGKGRNQQTGKPEDPNYVWDLVCAELCGWGHYKMQGRLFVHPTREDYLAWLAHAQSEQNRHNP